MAADASGPENQISLRDTFRALRYRNYRLFFVGQGASLIGTWIQSIALSWLIYQLTHSALYLGIVGFASQIATFILAPVAGVLVDRWNQHRILIATQTLFMFEAFVLSALVFLRIITVWQVIVLSVFVGLVNGFDTPTRQAFVVRMIEDRADLPNAIALNSSMFNGARLIGPAIAGILIAAVGVAWCFAINGFSYLAVIVALLAMQVNLFEPEQSTGPSAVRELHEGFRYTFGFPPVRAIILFLALVSLIATPYSVLLPVFATRILHGNASTLGYLGAAAGVGAFIGATILASRKSILGLGIWIPTAGAILGAGLIGFGLSQAMWLSLLLLAVIGFGLIVQMASSNTILQTVVDDTIRGRVMSFYTAAYLGMTPFGSLLAGWLASRIGSPYTVALGGVISIAGSILFAVKLPSLRHFIRPIYCEKGILSANLCGVQAASETYVPPEER